MIKAGFLAIQKGQILYPSSHQSKCPKTLFKVLFFFFFNNFQCSDSDSIERNVAEHMLHVPTYLVTLAKVEDYIDRQK